MADLLDSRRWLIGRQVVQAQQVSVAANLGAIPCAGLGAASMAHGGVVLEPRAAVAFLAIFETGEVEIPAVTAAVRLASFDGHAGGVAIVGAGEGA